MNYYERHIGDFISDTVGLSMLEDGAYNRLIDQCYQSERPLPLEKPMLYRIARAKSLKEKRAVDFVLGIYFVATEKGFVQKRVQVELDKYAEKRAKARASADFRWNLEHANALRSQCEGNANPDTSNQTPVTSKDKRLSPSASLQAHPIANANGAIDLVDKSVDNSEMVLTAEDVPRMNGRVPHCPFSAIAEAYHQELPELPSIVVLSPNRKRALQARWREVCTAEHLNAEQGIRFFRDFFKRIKQSEFLIGKAPPKPGGRSFRADFDWIINPANFIKIVEGRYHGRRN